MNEKKNCDDLPKLTLNNLIKKHDASIYHYTTLKAFMSIVESRSIWFTHYEFLNDPKEVYNNPNFTAICNKLPFIDSSPRDQIPFIFSTSIDSDSHTLWLNYSESMGINIEFDLDGIIQSFSKIVNSDSFNFDDVVQSGKVIYSEEKKKEISKAFLDSLKSEFAGFIEGFLDEYPELKKLNAEGLIHFIATEREKQFVEYMQKSRFSKSLKDILPELYKTIIFFKGYGYKEEQEYRLSLMLNQKDFNAIKFRIANYGITPYVSASIRTENKLPIKSITLGPKFKNNLSRKGIEYYLRMRNLDYIKIHDSEMNLKY